MSSYVKKGHHPSADDGPWCLSFPALLHPLTPWRSTTTKGITSRTDTTTPTAATATGRLGTRVISVDLLQPLVEIASNSKFF